MVHVVVASLANEPSKASTAGSSAAPLEAGTKHTAGLHSAAWCAAHADALVWTTDTSNAAASSGMGAVVADQIAVGALFDD